MENLWLWVPLLFAGVYLISFSLWVSTKNFRSALIFKIIPFFIGAVNILIGMKLGGVV